jgi:sugar lactone lactonase YvrE
MTPFSVGRIPVGLVLAIILLDVSGRAQAHPETGLIASRIAPPACEATSNQSARAFPSANPGCGPHVKYLGVYCSDGRFSAVSNLTRLREGDADSINREDRRAVRPSEVPPFITLNPREGVIENYELPAHAMKPAKGHSAFAVLFDEIVTLAYGREKMLQTPTHVTTDSQGRIIISDPAAAAVHILDPKKPFRIAGGPHRRLLQPSGVAVDAQDNIYIADSERGIVLVYDSDGRFLRYIGKRGNEGFFHIPTGIAIDRSSGRLYLLDSPRNLLFVLDLEGNILNRVGKYRGGASLVEFNAPTEIAVAKNELVVLDSAGSRIQILDLEGNPVRQFPTGVLAGTTASEMGLAVDTDANIYVSNLEGSAVRVYDRGGHLVSSFGKGGIQLGEFLAPGGLWVDGANRIYVADTDNRRVQVFQLSASLNPRESGE